MNAINATTGCPQKTPLREIVEVIIFFNTPSCNRHFDIKVYFFQHIKFSRGLDAKPRFS